jgi:hypothetical protein
VVTQILARQLGIRDGGGVVVASALLPEDFARQALTLYRTRELWMRVREHALGLVQTDWSRDRFIEGIRTALGARPG